MIVTPDVSVILKWVLPGDDEQDGDAALSLRDEAVAGDVELVVPQLWIYEVGDTLARRFPDQAGELLASLADFGLTEAPLDVRWRTQAVSLAGRTLRRPCRAGGARHHVAAVAPVIPAGDRRTPRPASIRRPVP